VNVGFKGEPLGETTEFVRGGNKEVVFNLELEFPILTAAGIKGVIFTDAGNAFDDNQGFFYINTPKELRSTGYLFSSTDPIYTPLGLYYSFGFGLRWLSPIGPLRFEWGIPITKVRPTDRGLIFEFTIGNFF
jgi:outer membrane protein insertion porin family